MFAKHFGEEGGVRSSRKFILAGLEDDDVVEEEDGVSLLIAALWWHNHCHVDRLLG